MMKVRDVMTKEVLTLSPGQSLEEAAKLLLEGEVSGVPVVEDEKVVGMLSEKDLLDTRTPPTPPRYLEILGGIIYLDDVSEYKRQVKNIVASKVGDVMTLDVATVQADASMQDAAELIVRRGVNRLPVVENERLVGIVTRTDILRGTVE